jgi:endonuclease YncB( thermonuclease family)
MENTPALVYEGTQLSCRILHVVDGDTVDLVTDKFTFIRGLFRYRCRLRGIDTPEHRPPKSQPNREVEIAAAKRSTIALTTLLAAHDNVVLADFHGSEKYGRLLVTLFTPQRLNINEWMIREGYAVPYDGGTKTPHVGGEEVHN